MANSYRELKVWQSSINLAEKTYRLTAEFPTSEIYGLTSQLRRATVSVASISPKVGAAEAARNTGVSSSWPRDQTTNSKPSW
jgi:hypothetical protein